jgi:hypothetical protein
MINMKSILKIANLNFEYKLKVIRINYRTLNPDEELIDSQTQELWKTFLSKLQDAVEYVSMQSPQILEQLDTLFNVKKHQPFIFICKRTICNPLEKTVFVIGIEIFPAVKFQYVTHQHLSICQKDETKEIG